MEGKQDASNCCADRWLRRRRLCSVQKKHYAKKKFSVTSNLRYMYKVLNVDEIKKLIAQLGCTLRDERFEYASVF
jgi:hypothetical protein